MGAWRYSRPAEELVAEGHEMKSATLDGRSRQPGRGIPSSHAAGRAGSFARLLGSETAKAPLKTMRWGEKGRQTERGMKLKGGRGRPFAASVLRDERPSEACRTSP